MKKRILSLLLVCAMLLSLLPTMAFATGNVAKIGTDEYTSLAGAIAAVPTDGTETTITMIGDETLYNNDKGTCITIPAGVKLTLDLAGHKIVGYDNKGGQYNTLIEIKNGAEVIINDNSDPSTGLIQYNEDPNGNKGAASAVIDNHGKLTLNAGTIENTSTDGNTAIEAAVDDHANEWGSYYSGNTEFIMNGGTLKTNDNNTLRLYDSSQTGSDKVHIVATINDGKIIGRDTAFLMAQWTNHYVVGDHDPIVWMNPLELNINGGTFESTNGIRVTGNPGAFNNQNYNAIKINIKDGVNLGTKAEGKYYVYDVAFQETAGWQSTKDATAKLRSYAEVNGKPAYDPNVAQIGENKYPTLAEAIAAVPTNGTKTTITMIADETLADNANMTIAADQNIVLDLNGKTVTGKNLNVSMWAFLTNNGTLEITDSSADKLGKITSSTTPETDGFSGHYTVLNKNIMTLTAGTIEETSEKIGGGKNLKWALRNEASANQTVSLTINGGAVIGEYNAVSNYVYNNTSTCSFTVNDGLIKTTGRFSPVTMQIAGGTAPIANITISGGEFIVQNIRNTNLNGNAIVYCDDQSGSVTDCSNLKFNVTNGKFNTFNTAELVQFDDFKSGTVNPTGYITGGLFKVAPRNDEIATGYACVDNTDSATKAAYPYVVKPVQVEMTSKEDVQATGTEVKVGTDTDAKVIEIEASGDVNEVTTEVAAKTAEAIGEVLDNTNVTSFADTKIEDATPATEKVQNVDGTNFDLSKVLNAVKEAAAAKSGITSSVTADNTIGVTVSGQEAETFTDADVTKSISIDLTAAAVTTTTEVGESGTVTAVTLSSTTFDVKPIATITVTTAAGTETIKAVIPNEAITAPITFRLPVKDGWTEVRVSHNGIYKGTYFAQGEPGNRFVELASKEFSYWTVENNEFEDTDAVAKTGNRYYDNLAEALKDAANGDTVTVLQNTSINEELFIANKSITLDLGGFTVDVTAPTGKTIPIHIGTKDNSTAAAGLTVKNGTINGTASGNVFGVYGMTTDGSAKRSLTLDGVTMNVTGGYAVAINNNSKHGYGAEITIKDSTLKAPYVLSINGYIQDTEGNFPKVKIENSTLKANDTNLAIYAAGYAEWDIDGSNITGGTGIYAKAGSFDIDGGKIEGNGAYAAPAPNGNGATSTGDGIIMDSKTGYAGNMTMDLNGVTVSSVNGNAVHEALTDKTTTSTQSIAITGGSFTAAVGKAAVATSETFDRSDNTTLTVAGTPTGVTAQTDLGQFTSFNVNYGDGVDYTKDTTHTTSRWSQFVGKSGSVTMTGGNVNFATMDETHQQLIANFDVTMGTVSYKTGSMTEFETIHSGDALTNAQNNQPITFQIECGNSVTNQFTFTPHWESVSIPYNLAVKPISGETVTVDQLTVTTETTKYVEYGVYASVPSDTTPMAIGSYNFELNYDTTAFEFTSFTAADSAATVEVNSTTAGKANVGVTLNTAVTPEVAGNDGSLTYSALLGTLKLKVKNNDTSTEGTLTTSITNTTDKKPVVTPQGYDKNGAAITTKDHTQYLITFTGTGASFTPENVWYKDGATFSFPEPTFSPGWSAATEAAGEGWNPATPATVAGPATYHYTAHHIEYTVTWNNTTNPMTVVKNAGGTDEATLTSGDKMYYEDTLTITVTGLADKTVIRNGYFEYKLGDATAVGVSREGDTGFTYKVGPNVVNANVVLSYTTSEYVTVTFSGGSATTLKDDEQATVRTDLTAYTLKGANEGDADALYVSVNDFIKGNDGTKYNIPMQVPNANARLVPPEALGNKANQQWKDGSGAVVTNAVLGGTTDETGTNYSHGFTADTTLTADAVNTYAITFEAGSNGSIKTTEPAQVTTYNVDAGTTIADILAGNAKYYTDGSELPVVLPQTTPANGYKFKNWTAPEGVTAVNAATIITGNFEVAKYSIGVSDNAAFKGLTGADATGKISMESDVTFKLMLKKNTRIESVSYTVAAGANGTTYAGANNVALNADANGVYTIPAANILGDVTVTVVTKDTVKVTVKSADTNKGTVGGTTAFVVDKDSNVSAWNYDALTTTAEPGYEVEKVENKIVFYTKDGETLTEFTAEKFTADTTLYVKFVDAKYVIELDELVKTNDMEGITYGTPYHVTHGTDAKFKIDKDPDVPQIVTSVTYSVEGGVQNVLLTPDGDGYYTIPGDRIIGKVTVTVKTLADEANINKPITALFILRDGTMTGVEGTGAYMANVAQNGDMKILALVSAAFKADGYTTTNKFFQLANGTQLYWSPRYQAYVCWVDKNMKATDLDGFVKFDSTKTATAIVNEGDINFDGNVDSADAGIVNDTIHGTRQVPTSALQLFEMDVANTTDKTFVNGATIDANDVTWILKNTVGNTMQKELNPIWSEPQ